MLPKWNRSNLFLFTLGKTVSEEFPQAANAAGTGAPPPGESLAFDIEYLEEMALTIWKNAGTAVNAAIWIFLIVLGVHTAITIFDKFAR